MQAIALETGTLASTAARLRRLLRPIRVSFHQISSCADPVAESIQAAVESKNYDQIPGLLDCAGASCPSKNPFLFLSNLSESRQIQVIDDILQSFIPIRPRYRLRFAHSFLLQYALESPNLVPLSLAVVQRTLRCGCIPTPQTHSLLSKSWTERRRRPQPVSCIMSEMRSLGYTPDCGTCNYLILSLCKDGHLEEALSVLREMQKAGSVPISDSYGIILDHMSTLKRSSNKVLKLFQEMVSVHCLNPGKDTIVKAIAGMRANGDTRRIVDLIEFLENENVDVGFVEYESALEGCVEAYRWVLAGKVAVKMTGNGFIPYIGMRQSVIEGLVSVGEQEFASVVRQQFARLKS